MAKIMELISMFAGIIPLIVTLINQFETPGFGPEKKKAILDVIEGLYDGLGITAMTKEKVLGISGTLIDIIVAFYNAIGWFKKSNPTPTS
jgi:hypothetical protein